MSTNRLTKITICIAAFCVAGMTVSEALSREGQAGKVDYRQLVLFRKVVEKIQKDYVREVEDKELMHGAVNGMLQSLDRYSCYLDEPHFKEFQEESDTKQSGDVGIDVAYENGMLTIVSAVEDSPGFKAGLLAGDRIHKIEGESTKSMTVLDAMRKMRGPKGTKVTITVVRPRLYKDQDIVVTRDVVQLPSLKSRLLEKGYAYIRLAGFQDSTPKDLTTQMNKLAADGALKGVVLDLRDSSGSQPREAARVANLFMDKGLIAYTDGRGTDQPGTFWATGLGEHYNFKLAVLINHGSAEAAEVLAGSLQDNSRALLFGTKSFGKASIQSTVPLDDGGALWLTTAYYYTPRGRDIQKNAIVPDVDLTKAMEKQREKTLSKEKNSADDKKKKSVPQSDNSDPAKDVVVGKALTWLKKNQTAQEFKTERAGKDRQEAAWYMEQDSSEEQPK